MNPDTVFEISLAFAGIGALAFIWVLDHVQRDW